MPTSRRAPDRRNPYFILGLDFPATPERATTALARVSRRLRRQTDAEFSRDDATWAQHEISHAAADPESSIGVFRVPANPAIFDDSDPPGVLSLAPQNLPRTTEPTGAGLQSLQTEVIAERASTELGRACNELENLLNAEAAQSQVATGAGSTQLTQNRPAQAPLSPSLPRTGELPRGTRHAKVRPPEKRPPVSPSHGADSRPGFDDAIHNRLLRERIVFLGSDVDDKIANEICAQLLLLASVDPERDIFLYINSPGGSVYSGMAIYETMQYIDNDVATVAMGLAAGMGQFLLCAGARGKRYALPHSRIGMLAPSGDIDGASAADVAIQSEQMLYTKRVIQERMAFHTGQSVEQVETDSDGKRWFTAEEARDYGIVDRVISGVPMAPD